MKKLNVDKIVRCHICNGNASLISDPYNFSQVTSDCKPWYEKAQIAICAKCGCVIKLINKKWKNSVKKIYDAYQIYHQSGGIEQAVFNINSGEASLRSKRLVDYVLSKITLPDKGNVLDIGCGNGNLLRIFNDNLQGWNLAGIELNDKYRDIVEKISDSTTFYNCTVDRVPGKYKLITMLHVLEHVVNPISFLKKVKTKLIDDGFIVIDVPNYKNNPFDLMIADHCSHFEEESLKRVLRCAGFEIVDITTQWIPKEISLIAKKGEILDNYNENIKDFFSLNTNFVVESLNWLNSIRDLAKILNKKDKFGIFGTSIAAGWLFGVINGNIDFFVDEDKNRIGKTFLGRTIYSPENIEENSHVLIALPIEIAEKIYVRLNKERVKYYLPPSFKLP